jgi:hypothetical protein
VVVNFSHQGGVKCFAWVGMVRKGFVIDHRRRNALRLGKGQPLRIVAVADDSAHASTQAARPVFALGGLHDGGHVGAAA